MRFVLLSVAILSCAAEEAAPLPRGVPAAQVDVRLLREAQKTVDTLTTAIVARDTERLATVFSAYELGKLGGDRTKGLAAFIDQQREGLIMTYGETPPQVSEVAELPGGRLAVALSADGMYQEENKLLNMVRAEDGRVLFGGIAPPLHSDLSLAAQGSTYICNFTSGCTPEFWNWKYKTYAGHGKQTWIFGEGNIECPNGFQVYYYQPNSPNWSYQSTKCVDYWNSCATKIVGGSAGSGAGCIGECCWYNIFGDDIWWNGDTGGYDGHGTMCHLSQCPAGP